METMLAIIVLVLILLVLGGLVYVYLRSASPGAIRALFVAPATLRETFGSMLISARDTSLRPRRRSADEAILSRQQPGSEEETAPIVPERESAGTVTIAYDETALANLREDLESELRDTHEHQQELGQWLQRIDVALGEMRSVPDELTSMMRLRDSRTRRQLEQLRYELESVRRNATATGARRDDAYADLYGYLAQIEAALATVINPMQLPGEPLQVPEEFVPETLKWENWDDVGEHAYAFGMAFNQSRMVLEPDLAREIEQFLATLRQALTGKVYPTVRRSDPTPAQLAQMRTGLESIVDALGPVRRHLEAAWHEMDRPTFHAGDHEDTESIDLNDDDSPDNDNA